MAVNTYIQGIGARNNAKPQVEAASKALRVNFRPLDTNGSAGGRYSVALSSRVFLPTANLGWNGPVVGFRWLSRSTCCRVRTVQFSLAENYTASNGGPIIKAQLFRAWNYSSQYSRINMPGIPTINYDRIASVGIPPSLRNTMPPSSSGEDTPTWAGGASTDQGESVGDIVYATDATSTFAGSGNSDMSLEVGVGTGPRLDTNPIASITTSLTSVQHFIRAYGHNAMARLWDTAMGDPAIVINALQGLVLDIRTGWPTTSQLIQFNLLLAFDEVPLYAHEEFT